MQQILCHTSGRANMAAVEVIVTFEYERLASGDCQDGSRADYLTMTLLTMGTLERLLIAWQSAKRRIINSERTMLD